MDEIVYKNKYAIAYFDKEKKLYTLEYLRATEYMSDYDWKVLMTKLKKVKDNLKPVSVLDDNTNRLYAYPPEIQQWTLKLFVEDWYKNGLKKYVQILPKDFISSLSAEQIVELANMKFTDIFENNFVVDKESSIEWLFD